MRLCWVKQITVKSVEKIKPKTMICNVPNEETKEKIKETILDSNEFLHTIEGVVNKMSGILISLQLVA